MSASLENVPRGTRECPARNGDLAEVTSLEGAVRAWQRLDPAHQAIATLTPERPMQIDGVAQVSFEGSRIAALAKRLPPRGAEQE